MLNEKCPCGSENTYSSCCSPYHNGELPNTAEKLMRSRYCAYVLCLPEYLIQTTYPAMRKGLSITEIEEWSKENKWLKLEIVKTNASIVEFKAHFESQDGKIHIHHERSTFTLDKGKWYYIKGRFFGE